MAKSSFSTVLPKATPPSSAAHIAERVRARGHRLEVRDVSKPPGCFTFEKASTVWSFGASVHRGEPQQHLRDFERESLAFLTNVPSPYHRRSLRYLKHHLVLNGYRTNP